MVPRSGSSKLKLTIANSPREVVGWSGFVPRASAIHAADQKNDKKRGQAFSLITLADKHTDKLPGTPKQSRRRNIPSARLESTPSRSGRATRFHGTYSEDIGNDESPGNKLSGHSEEDFEDFKTSEEETDDDLDESDVPVSQSFTAGTAVGKTGEVYRDSSPSSPSTPVPELPSPNAQITPEILAMVIVINNPPPEAYQNRDHSKLKAYFFREKFPDHFRSRDSRVLKSSPLWIIGRERLGIEEAHWNWITGNKNGPNHFGTYLGKDVGGKTVVALTQANDHGGGNKLAIAQTQTQNDDHRNVAAKKEKKQSLMVVLKMKRKEFVSQMPENPDSGPGQVNTDRTPISAQVLRDPLLNTLLQASAPLAQRLNGLQTPELLVCTNIFIKSHHSNVFVCESEHHDPSDKYGICFSCRILELSRLDEDLRSTWMNGALMPVCHGCAQRVITSQRQRFDRTGYNGCLCDMTWSCPSCRVHELRTMAVAKSNARKSRSFTTHTLTAEGYQNREHLYCSCTKLPNTVAPGVGNENGEVMQCARCEGFVIWPDKEGWRKGTYVQRFLAADNGEWDEDGGFAEDSGLPARKTWNGGRSGYLFGLTPQHFMSPRLQG
ncbi:hypothetical protein M501DRAFT_1019377 [Patellaria atrata CBS 101060]|uniref:Uncharacterized protein n=1 Tax=Patellaria atrata CBS 101060 TaxID=1346257 RepID=A0A9P4VJX9_9PEZI|nr:hypothetical protein M501DRAFT_1019377 [Patellaria atrata CBS 101060]